MTLVLFSLALACAPSPADDASESGEIGGKADAFADELPLHPPTRIILMIGDGMGSGAISAAAYASDAALRMLSMPHVSFLTTHEYEFLTTDSAASATAIATGAKTHFGAIAVTPGTATAQETDAVHQLPTVLELAEQLQWKTGLVATSSIVDATPAAFGAHRSARSRKNQIAVDLRQSGIDVLISGGRNYFDDRSDGQDLLDQLSVDGYSIAKTAIGLRRVSGTNEKVVGLLEPGELAEAGARPMELPEMVEEALTILDTNNDNGFFLMVEGSQIDRREHQMDGLGTTAETLDFDAAVGIALDYARGRDDTLVIVTADHETGGLVVLDPQASAPLIDALGGEMQIAEDTAFGGFQPGPSPVQILDAGGFVGLETVADRRVLAAFGDLSLASKPFYNGPPQYYSATHTATLVALFAEGPGSEFIARARDNAELGVRLNALTEQNGEPGSEAASEPDLRAPHNLVVVAIDMLGLPALAATHYTSGRLAATGLRVRGLVAPQATDRFTPDVAASVTSLSTGFPTAVDLGSHDPASPPLATLLELAEQSGRATGLVTTASLFERSVAGYYTGLVADDDDPSAAVAAIVDLAQQSGDGFDVMLGGGQASLGDEATAALIELGYTIDDSWTDSVPSKTVRVLAPVELAPASQRGPGFEQPTLEAMTLSALDTLASDPDGFTLVIHADEAGRMQARHDRGLSVADAMVDVDAAIDAAADFAAGRDDTLVVVVSLRDSSMSLLDNHYGFHNGHCKAFEPCGGTDPLTALPVAIGGFDGSEGLGDTELQEEYAPASLYLQAAWLTARAYQKAELLDPGSANFVPLFAMGPGSDALGGFHTLAAIGQQLTAWMAP